MRKIFILLLICAFLSGCGSGEVVETTEQQEVPTMEETTTQEETIKQEATIQETTITETTAAEVEGKHYSINGNEITVYCNDNNKFVISANAVNESAASLIAVYFSGQLSESQNISGYTVYVSCGDLFFQVNNSGGEDEISGINRDGSACQGTVPDWFDFSLEGMEEKTGDLFSGLVEIAIENLD